MTVTCGIAKIFSLEGIDGSGKSTQAALVKDGLEKKGFSVQLMKSPSFTPLGKFLRNNVLTLDSWLKYRLFILDIEDSLRKVDRKKDILIWDRYIDSFYSSNKEMSLKRSNELTKPLPRPIKTFLFDINVNNALKRNNHSHSIKSWLEIKRKRYHKIMKNDPNRMVLIDASQSRSEITKKIVNEIMKSCKG